jgi:Rrf2 family protein
MISSRVAVAVHVLAYMAWKRSEAVTSERIAASVNTNPVVVRRIVGALRNAGMVTVQPGVGGGATLAREPRDITLLDVYRAVEDGDELFSLHPQSRRELQRGRQHPRRAAPHLLHGAPWRWSRCWSR